MAGQTCLVTGSTGIAAATVRLLAAEGARVFVLGKDAASLDVLRAEVPGVATAVVELTSSTQTDAAVAACVAQFGQLDAAFPVAGLSGRRFGDGPAHLCTDEGWAMTLDHNLTTTFHVCRAALRVMMDQPIGNNGLRGTVVTMGSVTAFSPEGQHFATHAYAAAKAAVHGMTRSMAAYYAPHKIRINALAPGLVRTPMSVRAQSDEAILALMRRKQPLRKDLLEAEDIAQAALYLLSNESRAVTGQIVTVDGGWTVS